MFLVLLLCSLLMSVAASLQCPKRILVTGANKGIGKAICQKILSDQQDTYVFLGSRDKARGEEAVKSIVAEMGQGVVGRLECVPLDVSSDSSVKSAAEIISEKCGSQDVPLYGIVNNAGVGFGRSTKDTLNTNFYGPMRVCTAFLPLLRKGSRIVMISSASGPNFVSKRDPETARFFTSFATTVEQLEEKLTEIGDTLSQEAYGLSKASLNVFTMQLAKARPELVINACTPGFIDTDLTKGMGANNPPEKGTIAPLHLLFGDLQGNGWYYGSDAVRSPIDRYRAPGDPPYTGN
uniref:Ketoreductase (KR) domain-containing protein n=1 Tax=Chromera velia CCMP2878 TaxID=1169474 RepID=A0A0G4I808_9ALVE|mmetsp:Transcript_743/g.1650  ORF Transcript_743/g.1650 Transcript_743/m.1650 type:complete len:293 (+) Transcript_743:154-1032(+)|eukprot:Cvel_11732.t1-p1 / transcript=Cvel_11732.t1 / gene=Cvel_11732 / organism=Chromera_velia_CCMP2878 / gene_product=Carbonyl reductase [NADPH] 1, putative / transcript_product=Carbonyl reductase [NADPH] 1, putative / location=Cvel_scaffold745:25229-26104(-) / protein_length=292 / sequence_SO=supercontig / SO=protein_coding / is_pseudo=false